jgi:hypothetical protein
MVGRIGCPETSVTTSLRCVTSQKSEDLIYTSRLKPEFMKIIGYVLLLLLLSSSSSSLVGRDSSVGIATRYGLDGPGIESRWWRDFPHPSRPALSPTEPPVQWVPSLSRE